MINLNSVPVSVDSFCVREIGEETIFVTVDGDELHCLDEVGTFIWKTIDGNRSLGDIRELLCDEYEVSGEAAENDLIIFIKQLADKGIVKLETRQT